MSRSSPILHEPGSGRRELGNTTISPSTDISQSDYRRDPTPMTAIEHTSPSDPISTDMTIPTTVPTAPQTSPPETVVPEKTGGDVEANPITSSAYPLNEGFLLVSPTTQYGRRIRHVLFLLALGVPSTQRLREITAPENHSQWQDFKSALFARVGNINVVSSLILATTAAFLTTQPATSIANWLRPMPYVTLLAAFCLAFLGVGCGTFLLFVLMDAQAESLRQLSHRPFKFTLALTLLALPTLFVGAAGATGIVALAGAVWCGDNAVAKAGLTLTVVLTAGIVAGFMGLVF